MYESFFSPICTSLKEREELMKNLEMKFPTFREWYNYISKHHSTMIELAKWHVRNNWDKIDWSSFEIKINNKTFSNRKRDYSNIKNDRVSKLMKKMEDKQTSFKKISFVYDEADGDLSIDIDGKWKFMDDEEVIEACLYLEEKLKK